MSKDQDDPDFPVRIGGKNIVIDPKKMKPKEIYVFEFDGETYQAEKDHLDIITLLREFEE